MSQYELTANMAIELVLREIGGIDFVLQKSQVQLTDRWVRGLGRGHGASQQQLPQRRRAVLQTMTDIATHTATITIKEPMIKPLTTSSAIFPPHSRARNRARNQARNQARSRPRSLALVPQFNHPIY